MLLDRFLSRSTLVLILQLPLVVTTAGKTETGVSHDNGHQSNTAKNRNLRFLSSNKQFDSPPRADPAVPHHKLMQEQDPAQALDECQNGGFCDAVMDPITNPQAKSLMIPPLDMTHPFCIDFETLDDTEGFAPCPAHYDNIAVNVFDSPPNPDDPINPLRNDYYLHLSDRSGSSLACGTGSEYTGDWTRVINDGCYQLCFDINLFHDGCTSSQPNCEPNAAGGYFVNVQPKIILQGGPPTYFRAVFTATEYMTDRDGDSPGWRRVCAPLAPLDSNGNLPENEVGKWSMAAPNNILSGLPGVPGLPSPNTAWSDLLSNVAAIQLPVDFTSNPAERVGYDHICLEEGECNDSCTPEPLCYWKHEWSCQTVKQEEWYQDFQSILEWINTFDSKSFCLCSVLNECCPDLCKLAEQEFAALLLNIASGLVNPDCGVKECDDCIHTIKDMVLMVDNLLASSARSDYQCSKALHYLTGINQDELLCDSTLGACPQTERCKARGGKCVKKDYCDHAVAQGQNLLCLPEICERDDCTCMVEEHTAPPSPAPTPSPTQPCEQTSLCKENKGRCVKKSDCVGNCVDRYCLGHLNCTCQINDTPPRCETNKQCYHLGTGGVCDRDCIPIPGVVQCASNVCPQGTDCSCKNCLQNDTQCTRRGGKCMLLDRCQKEAETANNNPDGTAMNLSCRRDLCGDPDTECACLLPEPACPLTRACLAADGACVKKCQETDSVFCGDECNMIAMPNDDPSAWLQAPTYDRPVDCQCLKCKQNDDLCERRNGVCTPFCVAGPGEVCDTSLCNGGGDITDLTGIVGNESAIPLASPCACKYRRVLPPPIVGNYTAVAPGVP